MRTDRGKVGRFGAGRPSAHLSWPGNGPGILWFEDGRAIDPTDLPVHASLAKRLGAWRNPYQEDTVAPDGPVDNIWLRHGRSLLAELRVKPLAPQLARERSQSSRPSDTCLAPIRS